MFLTFVTANTKTLPIHLRLGHSNQLTLLPAGEEIPRMLVRLRYVVGGETKAKDWSFPATFARPSRAICARYKGSDIWLVLGTEDTTGDSLSFCVEVKPEAHIAHLLFADHSVVKENRSSLQKGVFVEGNIAKWIFPGLAGSDSGDVPWYRK